MRFADAIKKIPLSKPGSLVETQKKKIIYIVSKRIEA
jgi:hypothetical protein